MNNKGFSIIVILALATYAIAAEDLDAPFKFAYEPVEGFNKATAVVDDGNVKFDDSVTSKDVIAEMGFGWNLGNTFDAFSDGVQNEGLESETAWGVTKTTEEIIEGLVTKGFRTIRIPVTWHNHLVDRTYTISPEWMKRVKTVVDWAISKGLYVILNTHHDNAQPTNDTLKYGSGYYPLRKDMEQSERFLYNVWKQIATAFNNGYDHHLIFECLNEPRLIGTEYEWNYKKGVPVCEESSTVLNEYLRLIVKAIRESGGNNEKRFIMVTPLAAAYSSATTSDFIFPGDRTYNPTNPKILLSVHMYLPYNYAMNSDMSFTTFEESYANELYSDFKDLYEKFVLNGHHVVIGEMGTINKNNTESRIAWAKFYIENSRKFQLSCILWDNEQFNNTVSANEVFGMYHRDEISWEIDEIIDTYIMASDTPLVDNPEEVFEESLVNEPVLFNEWVGNLFVGSGTLSSYNSYSKFVFETEEPEKKPMYRSLKLFLGDWSTYLELAADDVTGAKAGAEGTISLSAGTNEVVVNFNSTNLALVKERGIYIIGHGFVITKMYISGPKLKKFEPLTLTKSNKSQKVTLYFSENATDLVGNVKFSSNYNDLDLKCGLSEKSDSVLECEGVIVYTGKYKLTDSNGVALTSRYLQVEAGEGGEYDNYNLIETKYNLDYLPMNSVITLSPNLLKKVNEASTLVLETSDLNYKPSFRALYLFKPGEQNALNLNGLTDAKVCDDGGITVPAGKQLIKISLKTLADTAASDGLVIKGYGFSVDSIFTRVTLL